jgi:L-ascorbate metabolism protein UlaG (beta-lactamase superfamily)
MQLQLIRNATLRLNYGGHLLLIDPYLAEKHSLPSFTGKSPNPTVALPCSPEEAIAGAELVLVSHLHTDHFDAVAQGLLPKEIPLFCQPGQEEKIREKGFTQVTPVVDTITWNGITVTRTEGNHGSGEVLKLMGPVMGFVLRAAGEPTIYWAGDTIWYEPVAQVIAEVQPNIIFTHSCGAVWSAEKTLIVMDDEQTVAVCAAAPQATVIAVHMEALDHSTISREQLRATAEAANISPTQLRIPADGELLTV